MDPEEQEQENIVGQVELHQHPIYAYLARNFFWSQRDTLSAVMLISNEHVPPNNATLVDVLKKVKADDDVVYFGFDYAGDILDKIRNDVDFSQHYTIFVHVMPKPLNICGRYHWLMRSMITSLLVPIMGTIVNQVKVKPLCKRSNISLPTTLLNYLWKEMGPTVMEDVGQVMQNAEKFLCLKCDRACELRDRPWHLDMRTFKIMPYNEQPQSKRALEKLSLMDHMCLDGISHVMTGLLNVYMMENAALKVISLPAMLQENERRCRLTSWHTYLILILDGENMPEYRRNNLTPAELLARPDVRKMLYAGKCRNAIFRQSHFRCGRLFSVLSGSAMMFHLRKAVFPYKEDSEIDEAYMIESLKGLLMHNNMDMEFVLLNIQSAQIQLPLLTPEQEAQMVEFIESGVPVYTTEQRDVNTPLHDGPFTGYYMVEEKVKMRRGDYQNRSFADVVHLYDEHEFRVCK